MSDKTIARLEFEQSHPIRVPERLHDPHPLIARTKAGFAEARRGGYGSEVLLYGGMGALDIQVTKEALPRALRIFDALIKAAEERGHKVRVEPTQGRSIDTYLIIDHHKFALYMRAKQVQVSRKPTEDERRWHPERDEAFDLQPTGLLYLYIRRDRWGWPERQFREGKKRKRLDTSLNEFFCTMYRLIDEIERREEERRREEEERRQREAQRAEQQRRAEEESRRRDNLLALVQRWDASQRLREFIQEFEAVSSLSPNELEAQLTWMRKQADDLDPLCPDLQV